MKRNIFITISALFFLAASCAPLHIAMDSTDDKGNRNVLTSNVDLMGVSGGRITVALGARTNAKDTIAAVLVTCDADTDHGLFNKGNRFMMRFSDGSEIVLHNIYSNEYDESTETGTINTPVNSWGYDYIYSPYTDMVYVTPYQVTTMIPQSYVRKSTNSYALYPLSYDQLTSMITKDCVKLRIETEDKEVNMSNPSGMKEEWRAMFEILYDRVLNGVHRSKF